ncbi:hypothetical protein H696_05630 [Fonticula alba]|uniref:Rieske domain-containing protein n=1 Tax=Fonticula alba TaxID=691883 RepID=A0A058Z192_FONAL|nr:hypothetical protein H696_05630 [Fonticula alba]KCV67901.1 hypothetical protein H696_05630 [Fonticula alba]|eukprot:XP_009497721.1 hypothetical protein H696_05630 [Fonticula alba]
MTVSGPVRERVASIHDLKDGEIKQIRVADKPVLLSRVKGRYYVTSHLCPHKRVNLKDGIISEDGTITCPAHGACFRLDTGDIEDMPTMDGLVTHSVVIEGEDVIVFTTHEKLARNRRARVIKCAPPASTRPTIVIVGGGASGATAAEELRVSGFDGRIVMISAEPHQPIDRIQLSKQLKKPSDKSIVDGGIMLRDRDYYESINVELHLGDPVASINTTDNFVTTAAGQHFEFDQLLVCSGANPRNVWPATADARNMAPIRTLADIDRLLDVTDLSTARVVIVGAGFIGLETAAMLKKSVGSITMLCSESEPLARITGSAISAEVKRAQLDQGIDLITDARVHGFDVTPDGSRINSISFSVANPEDGSEQQPTRELQADFFVIAIGVIPATSFAAGALPLLPDQSIPVDASMRVSGFEGRIWAAGDLATFPYLNPHLGPEGVRQSQALLEDPATSGQVARVRIEHWAVAQQQARVAARSMLNEPGAIFDSVPFFWTDQFRLTIQSAGSLVPADGAAPRQHLVTLPPSKTKGPAYALYTFALGLGVPADVGPGPRDDDVVCSVLTLNHPDLAAHCSVLMRAGKMPLARDIVAGLSPLDVETVSQSAVVTSGAPRSSGKAPSSPGTAAKAAAREIPPKAAGSPTSPAMIALAVAFLAFMAFIVFNDSSASAEAS